MGSPEGGLYHLPRRPPRAPRPSHTPPGRPNRTGAGVGPRLERPSGWAPGGRAHGAGETWGPVEPPPARSLPPREAGPGPRAPRPFPARSRRGGWGSGAGPGAGLRLLSPSRERARHRGRRRSSASSSPGLQTHRFPGAARAAGRRCVRAREAARGGPHAPLGRHHPPTPHPAARARTGPAQPRLGERRPGEGAGDAAVTAPPWRSPRRQRQRRRRRRRS